jgi:hypothetical protein
MKTCFGFMFWGLLLVALDFKFKDFDPLPDSVGGLGYALVAIGTGGLAPMTGNLVAACALGWLLVIVYIVASFFTGDAERLFDVLIAVLNGAMMWTMLGGVSDVARGRNRLDLAERAAPLRSAYVALVAISLVLSLTVEGSSGAVRWLTAILVVAALVVMGLIVHLIYRAWAELSR